MGLRVCAEPGCPTLVTPQQGKCLTHRREHEQRRGMPAARGYGPAHRRLRADWAPKVATGTVKCWRCGEIITATEPWQLGHDDDDRSKYRGPEHQFCNLSAAGRKSHEQ